MAAVFRTLVSSQEPVKPVSKKPSPSKTAASEKEARTISASAKRFNPFSRRKKSKKHASPDTDHTRLKAIRGSTDAPMYFNHPLHGVEARGANERGNRGSYANELQTLVRDTPSQDDEVQEITDSNNDVTSPKSFFDDDSDDKRTRRGRRVKESLSSLKVSTTNLFTRSRSQGGGLGSGSQAYGSSDALGISGLEQGVAAEGPRKRSPVIGTPTDFRRLNSAQDWADFSDGSKSNSPSLAKSPSTPSMGKGILRGGRLGKMPSMSNLGDWFSGRSRDPSPTKQHLRDAQPAAAATLRGRTPAYLARAQRRHQEALPIIFERSRPPPSQPRDAASPAPSSRVSASSSFYVEDAEPSALPAPLTIVKRTGRAPGPPPPEQQQQHLPARRGDDGKVVRTPSFLRRVEELGARRAALRQSTSHPALRGAFGAGGGDALRSMTSLRNVGMQQSGLVDDDAPPVPPLPATAPLPQRPFVGAVFVPPLAHDVYDSLAPKPAAETPTLRELLGLEPLRRAGKDEVRHPHHPFAWTTRKLMCSGKHNARSLAGSLDEGTMCEGVAVHMHRIALPEPKISVPEEEEEEEARFCALCGAACCLFVEMAASVPSATHTLTPMPAPTPTHQQPRPAQGHGNKHTAITDAHALIQTSTHLQRLRQERPNGVEAFETFIHCGSCGREVCPGCAGRCGEEVCGMVVCEACGRCGHEG